MHPGWPEIAVVVGLAVVFAVAGALLSITQLGLEPMMYGLLLR